MRNLRAGRTAVFWVVVHTCGVSPSDRRIRERMTAHDILWRFLVSRLAPYFRPALSCSLYIQWTLLSQDYLVAQCHQRECLAPPRHTAPFHQSFLLRSPAPSISSPIRSLGDNEGRRRCETTRAGALVLCTKQIITTASRLQKHHGVLFQKARVLPTHEFSAAWVMV